LYDVVPAVAKLDISKSILSAIGQYLTASTSSAVRHGIGC
jgi:hypothetical protein